MKRRYRNPDSRIFSVFVFILICCVVLCFIFRSKLFVPQHAVWRTESPSDSKQIDTLGMQIQRAENNFRILSVNPKKPVWKSADFVDSVK
jgi:hypothetical protein